jgi:hypothetical protein
MDGPLSANSAELQRPDVIHEHLALGDHQEGVAVAFGVSSFLA